MDYLVRDSLHCGVPYGRNFDQQRLIGSMCLNEAGTGLAITDKGRTATEMMVFSRYVMFSEVYWHHAVRSATAMFQRAFTLVHNTLDTDQLLGMTERPVIDTLIAAAKGGSAGDLLNGIFGPHRRLYKRLAQYSYFEQPEIYRRLARRPYPELVKSADAIASNLAAELGTPVAAHEVLVDAPPAELEVDFDIEVFFPKENVYRRLGEISPVVRTLAREQFDDYVKRVRIFVHPRIAASARNLPHLHQVLARTVAE
jgi:uncharacterized protein